MSADFLRTAHGAGAAALLRTELPPLDEHQPLNASDTVDGLALRAKRGRPFQRGNSAAKNRKPSLCALGVPIETADPRYRKALRKARRYMQRRQRELAVMHGGELGAGPSAMLAHAARATAASVLLYELAGETLDAGLFKQAASLADSARQQELTAVALAERERASMPGPSAAQVAMKRLFGSGPPKEAK
jgi:hypothetical protein